MVTSQMHKVLFDKGRVIIFVIPIKLKKVLTSLRYVLAQVVSLLGLEEAGFEHVAFIEIEYVACVTIRKTGQTEMS
jgi:hypothetical protein